MDDCPSPNLSEVPTLTFCGEDEEDVEVGTN